MTKARDRGVKFEDFATNGVAEYWIIDADAEIVEQYLLSNEEYTLHLKSGSGTLKSNVIEQFVIPIAAIFSEQENLDAIRKWLS